MSGDPSQNVHGDLLPHIHLLSTFRYPLQPRIDLGEVTKWLLGAPKVARDTAPFFWTYLDTPGDGTIYLTWQPLARRGTDFASDGYIWAQPEVYYRHDVGNGLVLEIFFERAGFRMGEPVAAHSRRRFRLMPPQIPTPNTPQVDPSLWIVHYGPAEKHERIPVQAIPAQPQVQQMLNFRHQLQSMGQIVRKEFILSDRVNWPQIPLPGRGNPMIAPPMNVRGVPQTMAYPPQGHPAVGPTPKRRGGQGPPQGPGHPQAMMGGVPSLDAAYDDDEDYTRGDLFDQLTPREVSIGRYQQNHEWMEELLSSPYRIHQIVMADLGLGLKGELASLTDGIFEAPGSDASTAAPKKPYVGHLDADLANDFRKRVNEKIETTNSEIEAMKAEHEKMLAKLKSSAMITKAELGLRSSVESTGPEFWRLEGRDDEGDERPSGLSKLHDSTIDELLAQVQASVGKQAEVVHDVHRVQEGGYQEPAPEPEPEPVPQMPQASLEPPIGGGGASMSRQLSQNGSPQSGVMIGDSDIDMGGTAAGLLDQMHTGFSSTSTPINNFATPQPQLSTIPSAAASPANDNAPSPQPPAAAYTAGDAKMDDSHQSQAAAASAPDQGTDSGDWVVVPKEVSRGPSPNPSAPTQPLQSATESAVAPTEADEAPAAPHPEHATLAQTSRPTSAAATPGDGLVLDGDNNDFSSLGDLDTAGDALAGYDPPSLDGAVGDDLDLHMDDLDDSAFGDAFHGVGQSAGDTPVDGGM